MVRDFPRYIRAPDISAYVFGPWRIRFAWHPTKVAGRYQWLRFYAEREGVFDSPTVHWNGGVRWRLIQRRTPREAC